MKEENKHIDVLRAQLQNELTESIIYARLSELEKNEKNRAILKNISADEAAHARVIAHILGSEGQPAKFKAKWTVFLARIFGLTFILKLMERVEDNASKTYREILESYPQLARIAEDEDRHENELIEMLDDERLNNIGSIVLGLNDALVELTGALAGFTFAIGETSKIAKLGFITGLAAAMSMAASAFLSARADAEASRSEDEPSSEGSNSAIKSAMYTGIAYIITVFILTGPYVLLSNATVALATMLLCAFGIIAFFNYYLSIAKGISFFKGFSVMAGISTIVALISYGFGYILR